MTKVIVHDCLPGNGKSSRMIEQINNSSPDDRWIVVSPFLAEAHRYAGTLIDPASEEKQLPLRDERGDVVYTGTGCNSSGRRFVHPQRGYKTKVEHISDLIQKGHDIVTTHAALKLFTPDTVKNLKDSGYKLVIDEELEAIKPLHVKAHRRKLLLNSGAIWADDRGILHWSEGFDVEDDREDFDQNGFSWDMQIKALCDNGSLVLIEDEKGERDLFMWEYPIEFLKAFDEIHILTYMFEGSMFEKYLDFYNIQHTTKLGIQLPSNPYELINIVDNDKMNRVGRSENAFSARDQKRYTKDSAMSKDVRNNLHNYFNNSTYGKSSVNDRLWTCLKETTSSFKGPGYSKRHIAVNTKAVNTYADTYQLAYVFNSFIHPDPYNYMKKRGDEFTPDPIRYSVSEMLQWIYRSRVRKQEPVNLYIPSSRMRNLLIDWMSGIIVRNQC